MRVGAGEYDRSVGVDMGARVMQGETEGHGIHAVMGHAGGQGMQNTASPGNQGTNRRKTQHYFVWTNVTLSRQLKCASMTTKSRTNPFREGGWALTLKDRLFNSLYTFYLFLI